MTWKLLFRVYGLGAMYWGNIGIMENKMETTIYCLGFRGNILGLHWDNGK